jgi:hypothetical protein
MFDYSRPFVKGLKQPSAISHQLGRPCTRQTEAATITKDQAAILAEG